MPGKRTQALVPRENHPLRLSEFRSRFDLINDFLSWNVEGQSYKRSLLDNDGKVNTSRFLCCQYFKFDRHLEASRVEATAERGLG